MAFITSLPLSSFCSGRFIPGFKIAKHSDTISFHHGQVQSRRTNKVAKIVSLAKSHPYGNGDIPNEIDYTNYDPVAFARELSETEEKLKEYRAERKREQERNLVGRWTLIMNPNLIALDNSLYEESQKEGFKVEWPKNLFVTPMADTVALREIENKNESIWVVSADGKDVHFNMMESQAGQEGLLCFARKEEAQIYANELVDHGDKYDVTEAQPKERNTKITRSECDKTGRIIGFVPSHSVILPSMIDGSSNTSK